MTGELNQTAELIEEYIEDKLFDGSGLMYSGIDSHTGKPFESGFITPRKVPRRAGFDPWSYWSYEDSVICMGFYLEGLVLRYELTGKEGFLERAGRIWESIEKVYSCSQVHGIGSFLRPYGGFERMHLFLEPLGTDQAAPLFAGLYRYLNHVRGERADDVRRLMLNTLEWYERQGFKYFYYKTFIHGSVSSRCHSNSYYLPAVAWAGANFPEDGRWKKYLDLRLGLYEKGEAKLFSREGKGTLKWGSELDILRRILGPRVYEVFNERLLEEAYQNVCRALEEYDPPGMTKRVFPESADPGFVSSVDESCRDRGMGFLYFATRHCGRKRPRHEIKFLLALASAGYRTEEITGRVSELLSIRSRVPSDFTSLVSEDYGLLPDTVHIYARSVGVSMTGWWRDYWLLRSILAARAGEKKALEGA